MNKKLWLLEDDADVYYVSESLDKLYIKARILIEDWRQEEFKKAKNVEEMRAINENYDYAIQELKATYDNKNINGFVVDELLYCFEVDYYETYNPEDK